MTQGLTELRFTKVTTLAIFADAVLEDGTHIFVYPTPKDLENWYRNLILTKQCNPDVRIVAAIPREASPSIVAELVKVEIELATSR